VTVSKIEWTDQVWNAVRGCTVISPGCKRCYAMKTAHRFNGEGRTYEGLTHIVNGHPVWTGKVRLVESKLEDPLHWNKPCRVFVNSMSDLFHDSVPFEFIDKVFAVMALCPQHTFQILTKRPERMLDYMTTRRVVYYRDYIGREVAYDGQHGPSVVFVNGQFFPWPLKNVWLGVSVESQQYAEERIPLLLKTPAAVRWVSYEPALGPVDFDKPFGIEALGALNWIVVGGESGPGARPFNVEWARSVVAQCKAAGVPCFVKQLGAKPFLHREQSEERKGPGYSFRIQSLEVESSISLNDRKGGDMSEWPADLRVRQYPEVRAYCTATSPY
jgi:protein gp37